MMETITSTIEKGRKGLNIIPATIRYIGYLGLTPNRVNELKQGHGEELRQRQVTINASSVKGIVDITEKTDNTYDIKHYDKLKYLDN